MLVSGTVSDTSAKFCFSLWSGSCRRIIFIPLQIRRETAPQMTLFNPVDFIDPKDSVIMMSYSSCTSLIQNFNHLSISCSRTALFVSYLVGNSEDRFSHNAAHSWPNLLVYYSNCFWSSKLVFIFVRYQKTTAAAKTAADKTSAAVSSIVSTRHFQEIRRHKVWYFLLIFGLLQNLFWKADSAHPGRLAKEQCG